MTSNGHGSVASALERGVAAAASYSVLLPDEDEIVRRLEESIDYWAAVRDPFIETCRTMIGGENTVKLPRTRGYRPVERHTYTWRAILNYQLARFGSLPKWQVVPWGEGQTAEADSEAAEEWLRSYFYDQQRRYGNFWTPIVNDVCLLDEAWARVDRVPAADWPDLVPYTDEDGKEASKLKRLFESDEDAYKAAKDEYKVRAGTPMRIVHVPLENIYPRPLSGSRPMEIFELDEVPLYQVLESALYDPDALAELEHESRVAQIATNTVVGIVRYTNASVSAYYCLKASNRDGTTFFPTVRSLPVTDVTPGGATLLYQTNHDLARPNYVRFTGRHGGWNTKTHEAMVGVGNAMANLQQYLDDNASGIATRIRRNSFTSWVSKIDPALRTPTAGRPKPVAMREGDEITLYNTEALEAPPELPEDENAWRYHAELMSSMSLLGGSPAIFGQHEPGVNTGYQNALQVSQGESLENMTQDGLEAGAIDLATLVFEQARVLDERLPTTRIAESTQRVGKRYAETLWLDPAKFGGRLPMIDASVTKPKPQDWALMARVYLDLTTSQGGAPPAMTRERARELFLGIDQPQQEERALILQSMKEQALSSGIVAQTILSEFNLLQAQAQDQPLPPDIGSQVDPVFLQTLAGMNQQGPPTMPGSGGVAPGVANAVQAGMEGGGRRVGGTPPGSGTPESVAGQGVAQQAALGSVPG